MRLFTRLTLALALALPLTALGAGVAAAGQSYTCGDTDPTCQETFELVPNTGMNTAAFWADKYDTTCQKIDSNATPVVVDEPGFAYLIIKAGTTFYVWNPAPAGEYSAPQQTSHYYVCGDIPQEDQGNPQGHIGGPCADPAYYAVMDNTEGLVPVKYIFRWQTVSGFHRIKHLVPAGMIWTTYAKWAKPGTLVTLKYFNESNDKVLLDSLTAAHGRYPACDYTPGLSQLPV